MSCNLVLDGRGDIFQHFVQAGRSDGRVAAQLGHLLGREEE